MHSRSGESPAAALLLQLSFAANVFFVFKYAKLFFRLEIINVSLNIYLAMSLNSDI